MESLVTLNSRISMMVTNNSSKISKDNNTTYEYSYSKDNLSHSNISSLMDKNIDHCKTSNNQNQVHSSMPNNDTNTLSHSNTVDGIESFTKRSFETDNTDEQDEENRKRKRKDSDNTRDKVKNSTPSRQGVNIGDKCAKSGKQSSNTAVGKCPKTSLDIWYEGILRNSPKTATSLSATESDNEDERSKNLDSQLAPKVPPLKIVLALSTTSEQEHGSKAGKNTTSRGHQLPYIVATSNSNEVPDKEQVPANSSRSESSCNNKTEDKKETENEERVNMHQRVLRSSNRFSGNSNNAAASRDGSLSNGNYSNSSPSFLNRSNNSSPQLSSPNSDSGYEVGGRFVPSEGYTGKLGFDKNPETGGSNQKDGNDTLDGSLASPSNSCAIHPRKRKMKPNKEPGQASNDVPESDKGSPSIHPHDQPVTNGIQMFLDIRKQIEQRRRNLFLVQPKPPQGFKDYLMNRGTYVLQGNAKEHIINLPIALSDAMKETYVDQEKSRYRMKMQHLVEKEKLVLTVEQEILRVHSRAARALANQSEPFSVCTILKDAEVYNTITPEQEEKESNARSRYNGRLFLSWLQDVDDKWEKIKEAMLLRHHKEAEALFAVQRMDWEWKLKEMGLCEFKITPIIDDLHVPKVHVSDDFDLLPA